jgi:hypothetical protein
MGEGVRLRPVAALLAAIVLTASCTREAPKTENQNTAEAKASVAVPAAAPPAIPEADPSTATYERAAPPTLQPVVLGKFEPGNPVAVATTGAVDIENDKITGANGASFVTERVALVSGDDQYAPNARYADAMMIEPRQQVELRHVVEGTAPTKQPGNAFCGKDATAYLALAKVMDGETEVVKVIALSGSSLPAASAQDVKLCAATEYLSTKK